MDDLEAKLERFANGEQKVVDLRNVAAVHADRNGWATDFERLTSTKVAIAVNNAPVEIDLLAERKYRYLTDDITNFRPYFTILFALENLPEKVTPHTVAHYTSINIHDVYHCLDKLAREGFAEKKKVCELSAYKELKVKARDVKRKMSAFEKEKEKKISALQKAAQDAQEKLKVYIDSANTLGLEKHLDFEHDSNEIQSLLASTVKAIDEERSKYVELSEEEKRVLSPAKPKNYYLISAKGKELLATIASSNKNAAKKFSELFNSIKTRLDSLDLAEPSLALLGIYHIPEEELENSYTVFKNFLTEVNSLPENFVPLFSLCRKKFKVGGLEQELTYVGQGEPFAIVRKDPDTDVLYATFRSKTLRIGKLSQKKKGPDLNREEDINMAIRYNILELANDKSEIENCRELGIYYKNSGIKTFYTKGNIKSLKLYGSADSVSLEGFVGAVFLPKAFDSRGIVKV